MEPESRGRVLDFNSRLTYRVTKQDKMIGKLSSGWRMNGFGIREMPVSSFRPRAFVGDRCNRSHADSVPPDQLTPKRLS